MAKCVDRSRGFTLIELVVVILILGILAATAAPKFVNLQGQARIASIKGARAAVASAATLAYALGAATSAGSTSNVTMDGSPVTMVGSYPTANAAGIGTAATLGAEYGVGTVGSTGGAALGQGITISLTSAPAPVNCSFSYTAATATVAASAGAVTTTGC